MKKYRIRRAKNQRIRPDPDPHPSYFFSISYHNIWRMYETFYYLSNNNPGKEEKNVNENKRLSLNIFLLQTLKWIVSLWITFVPFFDIAGKWPEQKDKMYFVMYKDCTIQCQIKRYLEWNCPSRRLVMKVWISDGFVHHPDRAAVPVSQEAAGCRPHLLHLHSSSSK